MSEDAPYEQKIHMNREKVDPYSSNDILRNKTFNCNDFATTANDNFSTCDNY